MLRDSISVRDNRSLRQQAYETIREAILILQLEPGQMVYETELSKSLDMSRTPIREAILSLVMEDLIEVLPQRGMKIALISGKKVEEMRFIREILEVNALRLVVENWNDSVNVYQSIADELRRCLDGQRQASKAGNIAEFLQTDELFHRRILEMAGNSTLLSVVSQMRAHLNRVRMLSLRLFQNVDSLISEHEALFNALQSREKDRAELILTLHLRRLSQDMLVVQGQFPAYFKD